MSDTPETDAENDLQCELAAWELLAESRRERDEARELHRKALSEREATEKEVDAMLERSLKAERERDEAREETVQLLESSNRLISLLREQLTEAREEAKNLRRMSVVELMGENLNVKHHVTEWENRCLKAERDRDDYKWQLHIAKGEIAEARQMERAWKKEETK